MGGHQCQSCQQGNHLLAHSVHEQLRSAVAQPDSYSIEISGRRPPCLHVTALGSSYMWLVALTDPRQVASRLSSPGCIQNGHSKLSSLYGAIAQSAAVDFSHLWILQSSGLHFLVWMRSKVTAYVALFQSGTDGILIRYRKSLKANSFYSVRSLDVSNICFFN